MTKIATGILALATLCGLAGIWTDPGLDLSGRLWATSGVLAALGWIVLVGAVVRND